MHHITHENVEIYDVAKKYDLMAAINSLKRLICYKEWRKYQTCCVASSFNCLIKWNKKLLILSIFVTHIDFFYEFMTTELFKDKNVSKTHESLHDECIFKSRKYNIRCIVLHPILVV